MVVGECVYGLVRVSPALTMFAAVVAASSTLVLQETPG